MRFAVNSFGAMLVLGATTCYAGDAVPKAYKDAKALADRDEKALSSTQLQLLTAAQGNIGGTAVSECMVSVRPKLPVSFALVMQLDASGTILKAWPDGVTPIAKCFESKMRGKVLNTPPFSPFYTVFEIQFTQ
jgi:hypothetical protein